MSKRTLYLENAQWEGEITQGKVTDKWWECCKLVHKPVLHSFGLLNAVMFARATAKLQPTKPQLESIRDELRDIAIESLGPA
eukprot:7612495-Pyramimonas_sp.AAC.1